jgi:hypothetical protein
MKCLLLLPALLALGAHSAAEEPKSKFIRFAEEEASDSLQTAVVTYESPQQVQVDLVGAVHIADKAYFDGLNTRFKTYDAVLYELVGPPMEERGKVPPSKDGQNLVWVGQMQAVMKDVLKLHGQLEGIDYQAKNFVHADMNMKQFTNTQETKKESFLTLYLKAVQAQKSANAKKGLDSDTAGLVMLLKVFTAKDSSSGLKRMIAQEFDSVEDIMAGVEAGDGTVLVGERNRVALEVMDKQIAAGKRRLAIFYGAAHLADMEERLLKKGFKRTQTEWLKAWNLPHEE